MFAIFCSAGHFLRISSLFSLKTKDVPAVILKTLHVLHKLLDLYKMINDAVYILCIFLWKHLNLIITYTKKITILSEIKGRVFCYITFLTHW